MNIIEPGIRNLATAKDLLLAPYGLGMTASQTGDVSGGLIAVSLVTLIAAVGIAVTRRFFAPGTV